ncbi:MAG: hypothetical protein RL757_1687 [Bacteroidota bacterium]|jgi:16S rRNA (adenine1518-N6/adenine1519-N6)-dimethyltransferase
MIKAKKSFGQHFLTRTDIAERIADSLLQLNENPRLLEVGPGQGFLTQFLLPKAAKLVAVEADRDMVAALKTNFTDFQNGKARLVLEDFMKLKLDTLFDGESFCLIGNFPYNISSQILIRTVENRSVIPELVGMFQKEVAERVCAPHGSKTYGVLTLLCQAFYDTEYLFTVDKSAFNPPPKVQSAVIRLTRKENTSLGCDEKLFKQLVKGTFNQRRKMLRNTVKPFLPAEKLYLLEDKFFTLRPEQLSLADFVKLTNQISNETS